MKFVIARTLAEEIATKTISRKTAMQFKPTRAAGLARLATFTQYAGKAYQERRNFDLDASKVSEVSDNGSG